MLTMLMAIRTKVARESTEEPYNVRLRVRPQGGPQRSFSILVLVEPSKRIQEGRRHHPDLFNG